MQQQAALPLPMTLAEITPAWLTAALRTRAPVATVTDAEIVQVINGTCTKVRIRLQLDEAARRAGIPERVMLKGGFEEHSRRIAHIHYLEARAYADVVPVLELPAPACYFAQYSEAQRQGIVIMEDLSVRGVKFCRIREPQSFEEVAKRLTVLARFHARTWNSPEFARGRWEWVPAAISSFVERNACYLEPETWASFVDSPQGAAASVRFHDRHWMGEALRKIGAYSEVHTHVLLHGDCHPGNLYVDADGTPSFFDFWPARGPFMRDIAYHVCTVLDTADRRRWEGPLLQHYLDELRWNGVDAPRFEQTLFDYGIYLAICYFIWFINEAHYQTSANNTACVTRLSAAMIDHDTIGLLKRLD
mgnify:CR=1 FL=1